jgi:small subunit ribosomal protein S16
MASLLPEENVPTFYFPARIHRKQTGRTVAVKIRLKRMGKIRAPHYRIVIADSRNKRDGRSIEEIGKYHPTENPSLIEVNSERAQYWLSVGAQPSEQVLVLLKLTGDWGKFKGDPNAKSTVLTKDSKVVFEEDTKKKSVIRPRVEKKVEEVVEVVANAPAPSADSADEVSSDAAVDAPDAVEESTEAPAEAADAVEADAVEEPAAEVAEEPAAEVVDEPAAEEPAAEVAEEPVAEESAADESAADESAAEVAEEPASDDAAAEDKAE